MAGFRIPSVHGFGITLDIDDGTLVRAASLPPGTVGLQDYLGDWVRRSIRKGTSEAVRLAGEAAYIVIMREVHELEHDLEAKLQYIAQLPTEMRDRVAYEAFAAGFDHYLPKKLLRHYVWGKGESLTLTVQEMIDCNPSITLLRSKAFRDLLGQATKQPGKSISFDLEVASGALTNGTLGQFTTRMKGSLVVAADGTWKASGMMSFYDVWDFDPKDFSTGGRTVQGELKTRFANMYLPGQGFKVTSETTPFNQSQADSTIVWKGGTPQAIPDRIAALDIELSKAE